MEMQLNRFYYLVLIFMLLSCKGEAQKVKINNIEKTETINFFNKKYLTRGYQLVIDESNISAHPFIRYLNCKDEGIIVIHFIPKNEQLKKYWETEYYKNTDFNTYNFEDDNIKISKIINNHFEDYSIVCTQVKKEFLSSNNGCSEESVFLKENAKIDNFYYDVLLKKWIFINSKINNTLPVYLEDGYFNELLKTDNNTPIQTHINMDTLVINEKKIRDYLNAPILDGEEIGEDYMMSEEDFQTVIPLVYSSLKSSGFKFISDDEFRERMKNIFGVLPGKNSKQIIHHKDFISYVIPPSYNGAMSAEDITMMEFLYGGVFFVKKYNFIMPLAIISDFAKLENDKIVNITPLSIIYRNKYLFNDDKASLVWLLFNDKDFLEQLVRVFGYDKEPKINEMVLKKVSKQYTESNWHDEEVLKHLFAGKDCYDKVQIREDLMKYILENTTLENNALAGMLSGYAYHMAGLSTEESKEFTKVEKLKVMAYVGYYDQLIRDKNDIDDGHIVLQNWNPGGFLRNELVSNQALLEEIKKNNYYNLSGFKDMIEGILYQIEIDSEKWMREHPEQDGNVKNITPQLPQTVHLYIR
ncbi:MAG: hypothetical protein LBE36_11920, partial [Flavobacteriaceae bacterium]|nr:hypothetical protein [Flavobacteriaceae bacterium]